jgi:DNA-binding LytR/AlgR family response regulator
MNARAIRKSDFSAQQSVLFYLLIPSLIAIWNGARGSVHAPDLPAYRTVILWLAVSVPTWWLSDGICRLIYAALRKLEIEVDRVGQVAILMVGGMLGCAAGYFYLTGLLTFSGDFFGDLQNRVRPDGFGLVRPLSDVVLSVSAVLSVVMWTAINIVFDRMANTPRFRKVDHVPQVAAAETMAETAAEMASELPRPAFLSKMPARLGQDIIAVEAHEHYIKVHTANGNVLLLYKFKDALAELSAHDGLQVHRSHWVAKSAVAAIDESKKPLRLILKNGLEVPVSHARVSALEVAGVLPRKTG